MALTFETYPRAVKKDKVAKFPLTNFMIFPEMFCRLDPHVHAQERVQQLPRPAPTSQRASSQTHPCLSPARGGRQCFPPVHHIVFASFPTPPHLPWPPPHPSPPRPPLHWREAPSVGSPSALQRGSMILLRKGLPGGKYSSQEKLLSYFKTCLKNWHQIITWKGQTRWHRERRHWLVGEFWPGEVKGMSIQRKAVLKDLCKSMSVGRDWNGGGQIKSGIDSQTTGRQRCWRWRWRGRCACPAQPSSTSWPGKD